MGFELITSLHNVRDVSGGVRFHDWIKHFDASFYRSHGHYNGHADLLHLSDDELLTHFLTTGIHERRSYNRFFYSFIDPEFYCQRYPELGFSDPADAIRHWMYYGAYEHRVPNSVTQALIDADIHLFQMGKVGSRTIATAFAASGYSKIVPHLHWADEIVLTYPDCFYSYDDLVNFDPLRPLVFVSGVREPIERIVSGLFESAENGKSSLTLDALMQMLDGSSEELESFLAPHLSKVLSWFDHGYFRGVDVYVHPFDPARGHAVIRENSLTIFIYRLDALERCWSSLCEAAGVKAYLFHSNRSAEKPYANLLAKWLSEAKFSTEFIGRVLRSKYFRHFFAGQEEVLARRWLAA